MTRAKKQIQREMDLEEAVRIYSSWVERDSKQIHQLKADLEQMEFDEEDASNWTQSAEKELWDWLATQPDHINKSWDAWQRSPHHPDQQHIHFDLDLDDKDGQIAALKAELEEKNKEIDHLEKELHEDEESSSKRWTELEQWVEINLTEDINKSFNDMFWGRAN